MSVLSLKDAHGTIVDLVDALKSGRETQIIMIEDGKAVARLVPESISSEIPPRKGIRLGVAEGLYEIPDDIDVDNDLIAKLFYGENE